MTTPERPEVQRAREWSVALAGALDEVTARLRDVARRLDIAWPDHRGREWAERLVLLRRALERDADAAAEFGRTADRLAGASADGDEGESAPGIIGSGPRLGDTGARRADDARGVRIPRWDEPADEPVDGTG